jgi:hypothetical protein
VLRVLLVVSAAGVSAWQYVTRHPLPFWPGFYRQVNRYVVNLVIDESEVSVRYIDTYNTTTN